jgi:hypothetical protein
MLTVVVKISKERQGFPQDLQPRTNPDRLAPSLLYVANCKVEKLDQPVFLVPSSASENDTHCHSQLSLQYTGYATIVA